MQLPVLLSDSASSNILHDHLNNCEFKNMTERVPIWEHKNRIFDPLMIHRIVLTHTPHHHPRNASEEETFADTIQVLLYFLMFGDQPDRWSLRVFFGTQKSLYAFQLLL